MWKKDFERRAAEMKERMSKSKNHVHKYERINIGGKSRPYEVYKCTMCTHYIPTALAEGRLSLCHGSCGNAVMMDRQMVIIEKLVRPMCDGCRDLRKKQREFLKSIPMEESNAIDAGYDEQ